MEEQRRPSFSSEWAGRLLFSIALALALWGWVTTSRDPERTKTIPNVALAQPSLPDDLVITTELTPASMTVKGPRSAVEDLNASDLHPSLDLHGIAGPGTYAVKVDVPKPANIWSISTTPGTITIIVEVMTTKAFPVSPEITGSLGNQQQVDAFNPETSQVTVSGPQSLVNRIAKVVLPVDIGDKTGEFTNVYTPIAKDANGETIAGLTITPGTINATVSVSTRGKEIAVITQLSGSPASGFEIGDRRIIPDTVLVDGPADVLAKLITVNTDIVNISGATSDISQNVKLVGLPAGVTVLEPASKQVQVIVQIRQRGVQQPLPSQEVSVINVGDGLTATTSPGSVRVTVIGNEQELESLSPDSLIVQVDASGLGPGTYQLAPTVILPQNMEWTDIEPSSIEVTIVRALGTPEASPGASPVP